MTWCCGLISRAYDATNQNICMIFCVHELILTHAHELECVCACNVPWCYGLISRAYDATNQNICVDFQQNLVFIVGIMAII